jgi:hypothetical protein
MANAGEHLNILRAMKGGHIEPVLHPAVLILKAIKRICKKESRL